MITDTIKHIELYRSLGENYRKAIDFLMNTDLAALDNGKFEIDGKNVFAIVSDKVLDTMPAAWEVHNRYADIHFIIEGSEAIAYYPRVKLTTEPQFPENADSAAIVGIEGMTAQLQAGEFMILMPQDVHMPNRPVKRGSRSKKIMIKVAVA